jgi:CheY-like chemotaxis protein
MPEKDGLEASKEIRLLSHHLKTSRTYNPSMSSAESSLPNIYEEARQQPWIVALTANVLWNDKVECLDAGRMYM